MVDDLPGDLMANHARAGEREFTFHDMEIRVANSTSCISGGSPCQIKTSGPIHGAALILLIWAFDFDSPPHSKNKLMDNCALAYRTTRISFIHLDFGHEEFILIKLTSN